MELKFSPQMKDAISYSREISLQRNFECIDSESLILGILEDYRLNRKHHVNGAVATLLGCNIDLTALRQVLINIADEKVRTIENSPINQVPLSKAAENVLKKTYLMAKQYGPKTHIDTVDLLLSYVDLADKNIKKRLQEVGNLSVENISSHRKNDRFPASELIVSETEGTIVRMEADALIEEAIVIPTTEDKKPLSLIFNLEEYPKEEVKEIISLLSELYHNVGGDYLKVSGLSNFEVINHLECV
jgi:ATP-dependent Clp protease ATP-binding subunit ClpA